MTKVEVQETVQAKAAAVWPLLSDFAGIKVGGPIESFEVEGEGVGAVRTIGMGGGQVIERLERHDEVAMVFSYSIINDDAPLPVSDYYATIVISPEGDEACHVSWVGTFEPKGEEAKAIKIIEGIYKGGIAGAKKALGV